MKRLNRKKLIIDFEQARDGFSQAVIQAVRTDSVSCQISFAAHYYLMNKRIVDLGGESCNLDWMFGYYKESGKEMSKALKSILQGYID